MAGEFVSGEHAMDSEWSNGRSNGRSAPGPDGVCKDGPAWWAPVEMSDMNDNSNNNYSNSSRRHTISECGWPSGPQMSVRPVSGSLPQRQPGGWGEDSSRSAAETMQNLQGLRQDLAEHQLRMERLLASQEQRVADAVTRALQQQLPKPWQQQPRLAVQLSTPERTPSKRSSCSLGPSSVPAGLQETREPMVPGSVPAVSEATATPDPYPNAMIVKPACEPKDLASSEDAGHDDAPKKHIFKLRSKTHFDLGPIAPPANTANTAKKTRAHVLQRSMSTAAGPRRIALKLVLHPAFEIVMSVIMCLYAIVIGTEADWSMKQLDEEPPMVFRALGLMFNIIFFIELSLRISTEGIYFMSCANDNVRWNMMDLVLVILSILEELLNLVSLDTAMDMSAIRLIRTMRLVKVARIVRVLRFFSDLRVMVYGIMGSARSLLWACILLHLVMFMFGVLVMQLATVQLKTHYDESIVRYYGSLSRTIMTLYMSISGGIDWRDASSPLLEVSWALEYAFAAFIFFTVFCCLNILTGIFVDNAKALRQSDEDAMFNEAMQRRKAWISTVSALFATMKGEYGDEFGFEQFEESLSDIRVQACFRNLGIDTENITSVELWELFDLDDSGSLDQAEFASAIKQFNGPAKSLDVYKLKKESRQIVKQLHALQDLCSQLVRSLIVPGTVLPAAELLS